MAPSTSGNATYMSVPSLPQREVAPPHVRHICLRLNQPCLWTFIYIYSTAKK
jgi:hypothetical protein